MKLHKLRIVATIVLTVMAVLLTAMWVRSGWWTDCIVMRFHDNWYVQLDSSPGTCCLGLSTSRLPGTPWTIFSHRYDDWLFEYAYRVMPRPSWLWGEFAQKFMNFGGFHASICVPYWFAFCWMALLAAAPWLRWRYSTRTLLLLMTMAAMGLGTLAYLYSQAAAPPADVGDFGRFPEHAATHDRL
jgi:hypothetical protein